MGLREVVTEVSKKELLSVGFYKFNNTVFKVSSNSGLLLKELNNYFKEWLVNPTENFIHLFADHNPDLGFDFPFENYQETGKKRIKEQYYDEGRIRLVKKTKTGVHFGIEGNNCFAFGNLEKYPNQLINFMNAVFMEKNLDDQSLLFHAAGVAKDGKGLVIAAKSGKGKSTTALKILNQGLDFISNDRVIISNSGAGFDMIGVPKHPRVNPGTLLNNEKVKHILHQPQRFEEMSQQEIWDFEEKYDVLVDEVYGKGKFKLKSKSMGLLIIDWGDSEAELELNELELNKRPDLLPAIMKTPSLMTPMAFGKFKNKSEKDYLNFLNGFPVFILEGKIDTEKGLKLIQEKFFS